MIDATTEDAKAGLRAMAHRRRAEIHDGMPAAAALAAAEHFFSGVHLRPDDIVAGYWPIRDEFDCRPVLTRLMEEGQVVCLPVVVGHGMPLEMRLWEQGVPLRPAGFGTLAPPDTAPVVEPDVVIVPILGFDEHGTRLGYGGGYYDRTLAGLKKRPRAIGFAFAGQELEQIPYNAHDVPLEAVVTEAGYRQFGGDS